MTKLALALALISLFAVPSLAGNSNRGFSVHAPSISGAPTGQVFFTGDVQFDPGAGSIRGGGAFHVQSDITQGPLAGFTAGSGMLWEAQELLASNGFKCSGSADEPLKTAVTGDDTVVFVARFIRHDGAPLTARVFISTRDQDPGQPGIQNVWIQGVGCAEANVNAR